MVYSVLQELARRDGLTIALAGLNAEELEPLLSYLARHLTQPLFTPLLIDVCNIITGKVIKLPEVEKVVQTFSFHSLTNITLD